MKYPILGRYCGQGGEWVLASLTGPPPSGRGRTKPVPGAKKCLPPPRFQPPPRPVSQKRLEWDPILCESHDETLTSMHLATRSYAMHSHSTNLGAHGDPWCGSLHPGGACCPGPPGWWQPPIGKVVVRGAIGGEEHCFCGGGMARKPIYPTPPLLGRRARRGGSGRGGPTCCVWGGGGGQHIWPQMIPTSC